MTFSIGRIVCGIDFSKASAAALDRSIELARVHGASVRAVHAWAPPSVPFVEAAIVTIDEGRVVAALARDLRAFAAEHEDPARPVETRAIVGWPADVILREAHAFGADLVVVGTRGLTGLPRFLLGSIAERIARTSPLPVLVVPEPNGGGGLSIRTILCGVDFSAASAAALDAAISLASAHRAALHLVHAFEPLWIGARHPELAAELEHALERELEAEAERSEVETRRTWTDAGRVAWRLRDGTAHVVIAEEAREVGADLVVLGSTGKSNLAHLLLGSVAERVPRLCHVPVLMARPRSSDAARDEAASTKR